MKKCRKCGKDFVPESWKQLFTDQTMPAWFMIIRRGYCFECKIEIFDEKFPKYLQRYAMMSMVIFVALVFLVGIIYIFNR